MSCGNADESPSPICCTPHGLYRVSRTALLRNNPRKSLSPPIHRRIVSLLPNMTGILSCKGAMDSEAAMVRIIKTGSSPLCICILQLSRTPPTIRLQVETRIFLAPVSGHSKYAFAGTMQHREYTYSLNVGLSAAVSQYTLMIECAVFAFEPLGR